MKKNKKFAIISLVLIGLIFATFVISLNMGSSSLTPMDVIKTLVGLGTKNQEIVIFRLRLPRILMAINRYSLSNCRDYITRCYKK